MKRLNCAFVALAVGVTLVAGMAAAQAPPSNQTPPTAATKWIRPVQGIADIQMITPVKVAQDFKTNTVTTTLTIKNTSTAPIAGLQVDEFWYDKTGQTVPGGDRQRLKKLVQPGEVVTITLSTQKDKSMSQPKYVFKHANGDVKVKSVKAF
jgi:uncharacterized protein YcfL